MKLLDPSLEQKEDAQMAESLDTKQQEDAFRLKAGKALYDENLRLLVEKAKLNLRCAWRVCMDDKGIIVHMIKCRSIEKPRPNSFLFITSGDSKPPKFGSFNGLSGYQLNIAEILRDDITKLLNANEIAYCLSQAPHLNGRSIIDGLDQLSSRFGELPTPNLKLIEKVREMKELDEKIRENEKCFVYENVVRESVFEEFLEKEKKKKKKRQRQKTKKHSKPSETVEASSETNIRKPIVNFDPELFKRLSMKETAST